MITLRTFCCCFCMLVCSLFAFAGCSSTTQQNSMYSQGGSITQLSIYYQDGSRSTEYQIKVDKTACTNLGLNPTLIIQKIKTYADEQENFMRTHGSDLTGVTIQHGLEPNSDYTYNFVVKFASFDAYCKFYNITQEDIDNQKPEIINNIFVSQYIIQRSTLTDSNGKLSTQTLGIYIPYTTIYEDFRLNICGGSATTCNQLFDKTQLRIIKCFPTSYGYRSNASQIGTTLLPEGINSSTDISYTVHLWSGTILTPPAELLIYRNYVLSNNRVAWYLLAIGLTVIFGAILTIVLIAKHNKKTKSQITQNCDTTDNQPGTSQQDISAVPESETIEIKPNTTQDK